MFSEEASLAAEEQESRVLGHAARNLGGVERGRPYRDL